MSIQIEMMGLQFLLLSSVIVTLAAQFVDHDRHVRPDTQPDPSLMPIDRFRQTTQSPHSHHSHNHHIGSLNYDDYGYDYPSEVETTEIETVETETMEFRYEDFATEPYLIEGCKDDEFMCDNGACLPATFHCNDIIECRDMSDEKDCDYENGRDHLIASSGGSIITWSWIICMAIAVLLLCL